MHSDCCLGPCSGPRCVRCSFSSNSVSLALLPSPDNAYANHLIKHTRGEAASTNKRQFFVCPQVQPEEAISLRFEWCCRPSDSVAPAAFSLLSFLLRSTRRSLIDLATSATRLSARGCGRDESPSSREATPVRSADWTTGKPPRGGPYHAEVPLLSLPLSFLSLLSPLLLATSLPLILAPSTLFPSVFLFYSFIPFPSHSLSFSILPLPTVLVFRLLQPRYIALFLPLSFDSSHILLQFAHPLYRVSH